MKRKTRNVLQIILAILLLCNTMVFRAEASPPEQNNPTVTQDGYVSLHSYVSPTSEKDVYRVSLEVTSQFTPTPLYLVIVLDETYGMFNVASNDPLFTNKHGVSNYHSRWQVQKKQYEDLIEILADPIKNPSYANTYVSVISNRGYGEGPMRIRTVDEKSFQTDPEYVDTAEGMIGFATLDQLTANTLDYSTLTSSFDANQLYFQNSNAYGYAPANVAGFGIPYESKDVFLSLLPEYPYMSTPLAEATASYRVNPAGTAYELNQAPKVFANVDVEGLSEIYTKEDQLTIPGSYLGGMFDTAMEQLQPTWDTSNPDRERAKRIMLTFSSTLDYGGGEFEIYAMNDLFNYAEEAKADRLYNSDGLEAEIWTVGVGFAFVDDSAAYPNLGRYDFANYRLFENALDRTDDMPVMHPFIHDSNWKSTFYPWAAASPLVTDGSGGDGFPMFDDSQTTTALKSVNPSTMVDVCDTTVAFNEAAQYLEPSLIALATPLQNTSDVVNFPDESAYPSSQQNRYLQDIFKYYADYGLRDANGKSVANYDYVDSVTDTIPMFNNMASKYLTDEPVFASVSIAEPFRITKFPGEPMLKTVGSMAGTATMNGSTIKWDLDTLPLSGETFYLIFYIQTDSSLMDAGSYYNIFADTPYLSYQRYGLKGLHENTAQIFDTIKYFPLSYVSKSGATKTDSEPSTPAAIDQNSSGSNSTSQEGLIPIVIGNAPTYTPSVTAEKISAVENERLQEKTSEVAMTGDRIVIPVVILIILASAAITLQYRNHKRHNNE